MMEVKVHDTAVVAAHRAAATRLRHKDPLDPLMAPSDRFADASFAPPTMASLAFAVAVEDNLSMSPAEADLRRAVRGRGSAHLLEERCRRLGVPTTLHEHMFVPESDVPPP
jgi:hypothetical protein